MGNGGAAFWKRHQSRVARYAGKVCLDALRDEVDDLLEAFRRAHGASVLLTVDAGELLVAADWYESRGDLHAARRLREEAGPYANG